MCGGIFENYVPLSIDSKSKICYNKSKEDIRATDDRRIAPPCAVSSLCLTSKRRSMTVNIEEQLKYAAATVIGIAR